MNNSIFKTLQFESIKFTIEIQIYVVCNTGLVSVSFFLVPSSTVQRIGTTHGSSVLQFAVNKNLNHLVLKSPKAKIKV